MRSIVGSGGNSRKEGVRTRENLEKAKQRQKQRETQTTYHDGHQSSGFFTGKIDTATVATSQVHAIKTSHGSIEFDTVGQRTESFGVVHEFLGVCCQKVKRGKGGQKEKRRRQRSGRHVPAVRASPFMLPASMGQAPPDGEAMVMS